MNTGTLPRLFGVSCGSRGHWFESGIHQALLGYGLSPLAQLEIEILHEDVPIKAHLDFTLETGTPQPFVRILEVKSTSKLPTTLPESHAMQIGAQTALLKVCWNQPVFNLVQENGEVIYHKTFPEICNEWLGVRLPDVSACDIQGWILCLSMSDAKVFYLPCHRVVNSQGRLVPGWTEQRALLESEGVRFRANGFVDMKKSQWEFMKEQ